MPNIHRVETRITDLYSDISDVFIQYQNSEDNVKHERDNINTTVISNQEKVSVK